MNKIIYDKIIDILEENNIYITEFLVYALEEIDNEITKRLNENPTENGLVKKSLFIWHALEKLREFLGV